MKAKTFKGKSKGGKSANGNTGDIVSRVFSKQMASKKGAKLDSKTKLAGKKRVKKGKK